MYGFDIIQKDNITADIVVNGFSCRNNLITKFENDKIFNENDDYIVILDGVVTNKKELEAKYLQDNWFETVIKLYENDGEKFFSSLRGSFAGALYIKKADKWIIFSD